MDAQGHWQRQVFDYRIGTSTDTTAPIASATPAPGTYESAQSVRLAISDAVDTAPKLYYTLDGSAPTTSSPVYNGTALTLSKST